MRETDMQRQHLFLFLLKNCDFFIKKMKKGSLDNGQQSTGVERVESGMEGYRKVKKVQKVQKDKNGQIDQGVNANN